MDHQQLFDTLAQHAAHIDRRGWAHMRCPNCGKEPYSAAGRRASHFSFSSDGYGHCFACGFSCGLARLVNQYGGSAGPAPRQRRQEPRKPARWTERPGFYLDRYLGHLQRLTLWQAYKPLTLETVDRFRLGIGVLPASQCKHSRLIVPVFACGQIVGFRGRAYLTADDCDKWLTCGSSQTVLYNADLLRPKTETVIVAENMIDCLLAMQRYPDVVAVASTAGVVTWREEWTQQIAAAQPERVIVWFDNDPAGQLNGPKVANQLLEARLPALLYEWPRNTPAKADLAWALMQ